MAKQKRVTRAATGLSCPSPLLVQGVKRRKRALLRAYFLFLATERHGRLYSRQSLARVSSSRAR